MRTSPIRTRRNGPYRSFSARTNTRTQNEQIIPYQLGDKYHCGRPHIATETHHPTIQQVNPNRSGTCVFCCQATNCHMTATKVTPKITSCQIDNSFLTRLVKLKILIISSNWVKTPASLRVRHSKVISPMKFRDQSDNYFI